VKRFTANTLLTGRYYIGDSLQDFPLALSGGGLVRGYNTVTPTRVQLVSISYVSTITPSITNEARLGWNRFAEGFFPEDRSFDPSSIGLDTVGTGTPNAGNKFNFGLPVMTVSGFPWKIMTSSLYMNSGSCLSRNFSIAIFAADLPLAAAGIFLRVSRDPAAARTAKILAIVIAILLKILTLATCRTACA
jgi:hypothetical protein